MQRTANTLPPRQGSSSQGSGQGGSPALHMARRIRAEQGPEQAKRYLTDMAPYLAPAERYHIADQLGIQLQREDYQPPYQAQQPQRQNSMNGMGGMGGMGGGMNNPMQLMQMLSAFSGLGGQGGSKANSPSGGGLGGMDPMMMAQLMSMLGKK